MTNLSELLPSGGGAKEFSAVASGTLTSGQVVALKTDGTVEAVALSSASLGTPVSPFGGNQGPSLCKLTDTTFLLTGRDSASTPDTYQATAAIGTVTNGSITFGTKTTIPLTATITYTSESLQAFTLADNKFVVLWKDFNQVNKGFAMVGQVSGGSITYGSPVNFETGQMSLNICQAGVALTSSKFVIVYRDDSNNSYGTAVACTVSATTITVGTPYVFQTSNSTMNTVVARLTDSKIVLAYSQTPNGSRGRVQVLTISGTTFTPGNAITYDSSSVIHYSIVAMSETQFVVSYIDGGSSNYGKSIVGSVSGTTITMGSTTEYNSSSTKLYAPNSVKINDTQFAVAYSPVSPSTDRNVRIGTITAGTIVFDSAVTFSTGTDSNSVSGITFIGTSDLLLGSDPNATEFPVVDYKLESTNVSDFIGITSEAIANTATGKVNPQGGVATSSTVTSVETYGSSQTYESAGSDYNAVVYDSNSNRVVVAYSDQGDSGKGYAAVGTVSGNSISFGTPVQFFATEVKYCSITFDPDTNQVVICFIDDANSDQGRGIVGSVDPSDNSITFGSSATFNTGISIFVAVTYDTSTNKVVCCYRNTSNSSYLEAAVGTVSGTSITFETSVTVNAASSGPNAIVFDSSNNKVVVLTNEGQGKGFVGTVLGSSPWISFGSDGAFGGGNNSAEISAAFDTTNNKVVVSFQDQNDNRGKCAIGTVSGTSITFGSLVEFNGSSVTNGTTTTFDSNLSKIIVAWTDQSNSYAGTAISGTVSGTSITFGTSSTWATRGDNLGSTFDTTTNQTVIVYRDVPNSQYGTAIVASTAGATANFVTGSTYYVQNNGNLTTTSSSVTAGKAISTTQLILNGAS